MRCTNIRHDVKQRSTTCLRKATHSLWEGHCNPYIWGQTSLLDSISTSAISMARSLLLVFLGVQLFTLGSTGNSHWQLKRISDIFLWQDIVSEKVQAPSAVPIRLLIPDIEHFQFKLKTIFIQNFLFISPP